MGKETEKKEKKEKKEKEKKEKKETEKKETEKKETEKKETEKEAPKKEAPKKEEKPKAEKKKKEKAPKEPPEITKKTAEELHRGGKQQQQQQQPEHQQLQPKQQQQQQQQRRSYTSGGYSSGTAGDPSLTGGVAVPAPPPPRMDWLLERTGGCGFAEPLHMLKQGTLEECEGKCASDKRCFYMVFMPTKSKSNTGCKLYRQGEEDCKAKHEFGCIIDNKEATKTASCTVHTKSEMRKTPQGKFALHHSGGCQALDGPAPVPL